MPILFQEHPLRYQLVAELHARVHEPLIAPERMSHLTILCGERGTGRNVHHLMKLLAYYDLPPPEKAEPRYAAVLGDLRLRWERHTEFVTYTFSKRGFFIHPFAYPVLYELPQEWLQDLPGEVLTAISLALESQEMPERSSEELNSLFAGNQIMGSFLADGTAQVWADLLIHDDGFSRVLVRDQGLALGQAGRLVKRLLDLSTYRALALLGVPAAREVSVCLSNADRQLAALAARMASWRTQRTQIEESELLSELTSLAAEIESITARTSHRFDASRAYYGVIQQRLNQLNEQRSAGLQTIGEFLEARLAPGIATCDATHHRQQDLADRAGRLTNLLSTQVEMTLQEQNRGLLEAMNQRAHVQFRLQETVEGLSVIAISYYGIGLVGYLLKGLEAHGLPIDAMFGTGLAVPFVIGLTWFSIHKIKNRLLRKIDHSHSESNQSSTIN